MKAVIYRGEAIATNSKAYELWESKDWKGLDKHLAEVRTKEKELLAGLPKLDCSPELMEFYKAYAEWLDKGAPEHEPFQRGYGLCGNLAFNWKPVWYELIQKMVRQFKEAGLHGEFPFDADGREYMINKVDQKQHLNPRRIAWVRKYTA